MLFTLESISAQSRAHEQALKVSQYFYLGALREHQQALKEAEKLYEHAHALDKNNPDICYALGRIYLGGGHAPRAIEPLKHAYQQDKKNRDFAMAYVSALERSGEEHQKQASRLLQELYKTFPDDEAIQQALGTSYMQGGDYTKALALFEALKERNRRIPSAFIRNSLIRAKIFFLIGHPDEAVKELALLAKAYPEDLSLKARIVSELYEYNRHADALLYLQILERSSVLDAPELRRLYLSYYRAVGDYIGWERILKEELDDIDISGDEKAKNWIAYMQSKGNGDSFPKEYNWVFDKIISQDPKAIEPQILYAKLLEGQKSHNQSIELLKRLLRDAPEGANLLEAWGLLLSQLVSEKLYDKAVQYGAQAVANYPKEWTTHYLYTVSLLLLDKTIEARKALEQAIIALEDTEYKQGISILYGLLGDTYQEGQREEAYKAYDKALEYYEDNADVLNNYAYFLALDGRDLERAERMALRGLKVKKDDSNLLDTYAWVLHRRGNHKLALLYMRKAIESAGDDIRAVHYDHYGDILSATGESTEAKAMWRQALELYKKDLESEQERKKKKELERNIKRLERLLKN